MSGRLELPKKVKIACFDIPIESWNPISANSYRAFGEFSVGEFIIRVDTSVNRIKVVDTFFHEINHAIFWAYNIQKEDDEERFCGIFSTAWTQIYRDNPEILQFVTQNLSDKEN